MGKTHFFTFRADEEATHSLPLIIPELLVAWSYIAIRKAGKSSIHLGGYVPS